MEAEEREEILKRVLFLMDEDLSEWEEDFLESCEKRLREGKDLSSGQMEKLEEMEEKYL